MSAADLAAQRCRALEGHTPMTADDIARHLALVPGWALADGSIEKTYTFADYPRTLASVNALGWMAEREDHHPDLLVRWGRCTVRFNTHSVGGISLNDFICAAKADALVAN